MKKLSKIVVKDQAETLDKEEMKLILGGSARAYFCCCGIKEDYGSCQELHEYGINYALAIMRAHCYNSYGGEARCTGIYT